MKTVEIKGASTTFIDKQIKLDSVWNWYGSHLCKVTIDQKGKKYMTVWSSPKLKSQPIPFYIFIP